MAPSPATEVATVGPTSLPIQETSFQSSSVLPAVGSSASTDPIVSDSHDNTDALSGRVEPKAEPKENIKDDMEEVVNANEKLVICEGDMLHLHVEMDDWDLILVQNS